MNTRIKQARKSAGLTQAQLAEKIHLSRNFINLIESGKEKPSDRTIEDISSVCKVNTAWIITGEGDMKSPQTREDEISEIAATMFHVGSESFRYQMIKMIAQMDANQMRALKEMVLMMSEAAKNDKE